MDAPSFPPRHSSLSSPTRAGSVGSSKSIRPTNLSLASLWSFGKQQTHKSISPVKRKPLPPNSPALVKTKSGATEVDRRLNPPSATSISEAPSPLPVRDLDQFPRGHSPLLPTRSLHRKFTSGSKGDRSSNSGARSPLSSPGHSRGLSAPPGSMPAIGEYEDGMHGSKSKASPSNSRPPPLKMRSTTLSPSDTATEPKQPRTPGGKITQFFANWKGNASLDGDSSSTEPSDSGLSPLTSRYSARSFPHGLDTYKSDTGRDGGVGNAMAESSLLGHDVSTTRGQLEEELKEISYELAGSIRREMELEDLVDKLRLESSGTNDDTRTSDYYSDSSTGSTRIAALEGSRGLEELDKVKRQAEQERAQLKLDFSQRWQEEIARRRELESHVQSLESQLSESHSIQVEDPSTLSIKHKELEAALENARRGLAGERQMKETVQGHLSSLRDEIEQGRQERDQLRDEIVPQLQAKLLSKNIEPRTPTFDFARMQQDIQALKDENAALKEARKSQQDIPPSRSRFDAISEEHDIPTSLNPKSPSGLARSNSTARTPGRNRGLTRSGSLSRSNSTGGKSPVEPREILADRMKDVEHQRDALHRAMRALLARQECQAKDYERQIRTLELDRDRAMLPPTPRKLGYEKEVRNLREEINRIRCRADDALAQKLQCEKGLGGLKMDLDRSEQETSTLRKLLKEHEIALPDQSSDSLQHAYDQLRQDRVDAATLMAETSSRSVEDDQQLAEQLQRSDERSEELAQQMAEQQTANQALGDKLGMAIGRGERIQAACSGQITALETKLGVLEEVVTAAQQKFEGGVVAHEEEIRLLKEAHHAQLHRLKAAGYRSPTSPGSRNDRGLAPLVSPIFAQRNPKLDVTTSGQGMRLDQSLKTEQLQKKVSELELELENTDREMQLVVERVNGAQIEVMELQVERDDALKQTTKLQTAIMKERNRVRSLVDSLKEVRARMATWGLHSIDHDWHGIF